MKNELLSAIIGKKISNISRVCDLISIQFGLCEQGGVTLHIQSFCRFVQNNKIIISSEDMYRCDKNHDADAFSWDKPGESVYDNAMEIHKNILYESSVIDVSINDIGDFTVVFDNDLMLQVFINTIEKEEKYRIIDVEKHIVFNS